MVRRQAHQVGEEGLRRTRWYIRAIENVLHAELTAAGYHQHDQGQWRKKRPRKKRENNDMATEMQQAAQAEMGRRGEALPDVPGPGLSHREWCGGVRLQERGAAADEGGGDALEPGGG